MCDNVFLVGIYRYNINWKENKIFVSNIVLNLICLKFKLGIFILLKLIGSIF